MKHSNFAQKVFTYMGLIGSVLGLAGAVAGGIKAGNTLKKNEKMWGDRIARYQNHMDAVVNEDPTQNVATQAAITAANAVNQQNQKNTAAARAITGGTEEATAQQRAQGAQVVGQMLQNATVQGQQRADQAWAQGNQAIDQMNAYIAAARQARANATMKAASGVAGAAGELDLGTTNIFGKKIAL